MRNIFIAVLVLMCSMVFGQGVSYRIEGMGSDMAGIISDHETDVLRNPAHIFDGDFIRVQREILQLDYIARNVYRVLDMPNYSIFMVKHSFGILAEGGGKYNSSHSYSYKTTIGDYLVSGRLLKEFQLSSTPIGFDAGGEIKKTKQFLYGYDTCVRYQEIDHLKIGGIFGERNQHEIILSGNITKMNFRYIRYDNITRASFLQILPRISYSYITEAEKNKKRFHLLVDLGSPNSFDEMYPLTEFVGNGSIADAYLVGRISTGWEHYIYPKTLIAYGVVYKTNVLFANHYNINVNDLALPLSIEYQLTKYLYLRVGTSSSGTLTFNTYQIGCDKDFQSAFVYSSGVGIRTKKFSMDFVIPGLSILYPGEWKIRACYDL
jgi:hypothetical protein